VLGAILSLLSAASFALNVTAARRGVITGTPIQGTALTVPIGVACFLPVAIATGQIARLGAFPLAAAGWMAAVGVLHFLLGRYCNYRANQAAGVNITAPVVQLQIVVTLALAVIILHERCSILQMLGAGVMLTGALVTQYQRPAARPPPLPSPASTGGMGGGMAPALQRRPSGTVFVARYLPGYLFASLAALAYGTSPIMARFALENTGAGSGIVGGLVAYCAATAVVAVAMISPRLRREVTAVKRENIRWFGYSGVFVAMAQGFFFSAVAVAPIMVVSPLLQFSLLFRLLFSRLFNPDHEIFGRLVVAGVATSIMGSLAVAADTEAILRFLSLPEWLAATLRWHF
jgi:drug/metabolite transporter (DMT)-like permease